MDKRRLAILASIILFVFIVISFGMKQIPVAEYDMAGIINKSLSKSYNEKMQIEIFETSNILEYKIIGFTYDNNYKCGYAVMQKKNDRYKLLQLIRYERLMEAPYRIYRDTADLWDETAKQSIPYYVIISLNEQLSKIEYSLDSSRGTIENISSPSMMLFEILPNSDNEFKLYDPSGNLIQ